MKKYKHTKLGLEAEWSNQDDMYIIWFDNKGMKHFIDKILIENSNDWEEVKEESKKPFFNPTPMPNPADKIKPKEEPNYLITAFKSNTNYKFIMSINEKGKYTADKRAMGVSLDEMLHKGNCVDSGGYEIYSVKNSRGEEFVLSEVVKFCQVKLPIIKFEILSSTFNEMCVILSNKNRYTLDSVSKVKSPIYTTTDGVDIYEGETKTLFLIRKDLNTDTKMCRVLKWDTQDSHVADRFYSFISEENRDKYIKENSKKFLFTTKDGVKIYNGDTYYLCVGNIVETYTADENLDWTEGDNGIRFYDKEKALEYIKENSKIKQPSIGEMCEYMIGLHKPERKPIFVSADGVELFEGDKYYPVNIGKNEYYTWKTYECEDEGLSEKTTIYKHIAYFSTEEARQEYIDNNKPKYSLADIEKAYCKAMNSEFNGLGEIIEELKKLGK